MSVPEARGAPGGCLRTLSRPAAIVPSDVSHRVLGLNNPLLSVSILHFVTLSCTWGQGERPGQRGALLEDLMPAAVPLGSSSAPRGLQRAR